MKKLIVVLALLIVVATNPSSQAQGTSKPKLSGDLKNDPAREEEFMDWGLGMFVHWSLDSQLGAVISHSLEMASQKYVDRYFNELPKTFNPTEYDPDKWMEIAKLAGVKYMVLTVKHHSGFCMWDTKTTDFSIMHTPYGKDIVRPYVYAFLTQFTSNDPQGKTQWGRQSRKKVLLKELKATDQTVITVLGQDDREERYSRRDLATRFNQTEEGLEIDVMRAQRLYNNRRWPNAVVLRLENVEFID